MPLFMFGPKGMTGPLERAMSPSLAGDMVG